MRVVAATAAGFLAGALVSAVVAAAAQGRATPEPPPLRHPVVVTLHRLELKPDKLARFDDWMRLYQTEHRATVGTLERERTYFEAMFRDRVRAPEVIWWLEAQGDGGARVESSPLEIDRRHEAFMQEVLKPGAHTRLSTEFGLMPDFLVAAIRAHQAAEVEPARGGPPKT